MMCFGLKDRKRLKTNHCVIVLLDDTQLVHELHASSTGQDLLDVVIKHLNLLETSYFGLKYLDASRYQGSNNERSENRVSEQVWLDVNKSAIKQLKDVQPMTVYFCVKYYASDPCKLAEEITRYQFFLQCKQDILHSRLPVPFDLAIELFALAVQSELGDYDPQRHRDGYVSEFQFLAVNQSAELERRVALFHQTLSGQVPATAELNFLERVKWLDLYGCELHPIQYEDNGEEYALGLNPNGVLVLRNRLKVAFYMWPHIVKTKCQGRCFLMDVIDLHGASASGSAKAGSSKAASSAKQQQANRNRFGFRLVDKDASRRLRWAIEDHKSFYHLVHNSASLSQLASSRQQQQLKLSQRFRNSIRSAISVGAFSQQAAHLNAQAMAQHQKLRSSMKSLNEAAAAAAHLQHQQHYNGDRAPPSVVRMPSRRYSNRSLSRPPQFPVTAANGNGLPAMPHTMVDGQRQQALMMMSQLNQMNGAMMGKAHTLKPVSKDMRRNPYYHMMANMMVPNSSGNAPEVAYIPAGQHIVQPSIYKAASVVNGLNQAASLAPQSAKQSALMQFFNSRPVYGVPGHESPRSTKSAIAPSSAVKLASKKLAKQQQLLYANHPDVQPLLEPTNNDNPSLLYATQAAPYYGVSAPYSTNPSPRSVRSARLINRHKSKSTNENLHLLHNRTNYRDDLGSSKMLLTTAQDMMPPPTLSNYANQSFHSASKKRTTFAIDDEKANLLISAPNMMPRARAQTNNGRGLVATSDGDDDDYYCSRSDCSSIQDRAERRRAQRSNKPLTSTERPNQDQGGQQRRRNTRQPNAMENGSQQQSNRQIQGDWNSIKRRHDEFSNGKGYLADSANSFTNQELMGNQESLGDVNNNYGGPKSNVVKNISNKQATPILLSMNYEHSNANSKAVQLLNLQRQQLTSQPANSSLEPSHFNKGQPMSVGSEPSSAASSSPNVSVNHPEDSSVGAAKVSSKTSDSAASSSTTSGYYAGSNSTGSASLDSDSHMNAEASPGSKPGITRRPVDRERDKSSWQGYEETGSRAKIALGSYGSRIVAGSRAHFNSKKEQQPQVKSANNKQFSQQRFYLGDPNKHATGSGSTQRDDSISPIDNDGQWSPLNQIQQHAPSSLKYVSFDV